MFYYLNSFSIYTAKYSDTKIDIYWHFKLIIIKIKINIKLKHYHVLMKLNIIHLELIVFVSLRIT